MYFCSMSKKELSCSFCGRKKSETRLLIAGMDAHICDKCIEQAHGIVLEEVLNTEKQDISSDITLKKPKEIKEFLDQYVIGQNDAKKVLAVAVYNHYKRVINKEVINDVEIEKSNIVMVGPTGTGKTLLASSIARMLNVPFTIVDATVLTEAGYVGEDVESILSRLLQAADYNVQKAERGIIFIDEIDKIARKGDNPSITRDVSGEGVQQAMLKLLEGSIIKVPPQGGRKHPDQKFVEVNTKNILFIAGGAFSGVERKIGNRLNTRSIGYQKDFKDQIDEENLLQYILPMDLKSFGLIPELIGRLPVLTHLETLDEDALRRILTEPKNAITKQYKRLFEIDEVELEIDDATLDFVVEKAIEFKLGARGLRSIIETILTDAMYDSPTNDESKVVITREYAEEMMSQSKLKRLKAV